MLDPKPFILPIFPTNPKNCLEPKRCTKKTKGEDCVFTRLSESLHLLRKKLLKDNLIATVPKLRISIPKEFDTHDHCLYHMDMPGHKTKDHWASKHNIQDLIDARVIAIDLLNQNMRLVNILKFTTSVPIFS